MYYVVWEPDTFFSDMGTFLQAAYKNGHLVNRQLSKCILTMIAWDCFLKVQLAILVKNTFRNVSIDDDISEQSV